MNVAADFNAAYPLEGENNQLDNQHNGQPSLIYRGRDNRRAGNCIHPRSLGAHRAVPVQRRDYREPGRNGYGSQVLFQD